MIQNTNTCVHKTKKMKKINARVLGNGYNKCHFGDKIKLQYNEHCPPV